MIAPRNPQEGHIPEKAPVCPEKPPKFNPPPRSNSQETFAVEGMEALTFYLARCIGEMGQLIAQMEVATAKYGMGPFAELPLLRHRLKQLERCRRTLINHE